MKAKILIIDDSVTDLTFIKGMLQDFEVLTALNGADGLEIIKNHLDLDLVILDLDMPIMNGFELLALMKDHPCYKNIRVVILTNADEIESEIKGLELGAVDYIRKPINLQSLRIRINVHLNLKASQDQILHDNEVLDETVKQKTHELIVTRDITIHALVGLLEARNIESSSHTIRTQKMMQTLCEHLKRKPSFSAILSDDYIQELVSTTPLHDIGKVGIEDRILLKPGKLTPDEYEMMKRHVEYGVNALKTALENYDDMPDFIKTAVEIIESHHEKYDGTGYPHGLKGKTIPLSGRLMAIVDVFDALISARVYKPAFSYADAIRIIESNIGTHFDPEIAKAFLEVKDAIHKITVDHP